jgi:uncharacterized membrane protein (UPF0127 family)
MSWMDAARAAALGLMLAVGACAPKGEAAVAESGMRIDEVTVETANGAARFDVEVAATEEQQARGLMFRRELADDRGMLFDFDRPQMAVFWMRNTVIPLDIIFIGVDGRIINIAERTTPYSEDPIPADGLTRAVLEIRGGRAAELGIRPGDRVRHSIFPS